MSGFDRVGCPRRCCPPSYGHPIPTPAPVVPPVHQQVSHYPDLEAVEAQREAKRRRSRALGKRRQDNDSNVHARQGDSTWHPSSFLVPH